MKSRACRRPEERARQKTVEPARPPKPATTGSDVETIELPDDPAVLQRMIRDLLEQLAHARKNEGFLQQKIDALLHRLYGKKSEKLTSEQLELFADQSNPAQPEAEEPAVEAEEAPRRHSRGHGRKRLPEDLPRRRVVHDLSEAERLCPCCSEPMVAIREEVSEQLDYEPASLHVIEHVRPVYACPKKCDEAVAISTKPSEPIDKGLAGPGLLAHVIVSKYDSHLPLHRQSGILARLGVELGRSTLCDWVAASAELLEPVVARMKDWMLEGDVLGTDDTPVSVLNAPAKGTHTGRLWIYVGDDDHRCELFDYTPDRCRDGPVAYLGDWSGKLQADAYSGYRVLYESNRIVEIGCWMHARRYFYDARRSDPARATEVLAMIRGLYEAEKECRGRSPEARRAHRQEHALPWLVRIEAWLEKQAPRVPPKSKLGEAIVYLENQWKALCRYVDDGRLEIDNGRSERGLRPVAVGRKNWLFAGSDEGGRRAAILYGLIRTCKLHGVDPEAYLRDVLARVPSHPASRIHDLTPMAWAAERAAAQAS